MLTGKDERYRSRMLIMPMLSELQSRYGNPPRTVAEPSSSDQEVLVSDTRNGLNSKAILEDKFGKALLHEQARFVDAQTARQRPRELN